jgi:DNA-binding transcriptional ArsR family regulator
MAKQAPIPVPASDQDLEQLASLFQLLSDKTRLQILMLLTKGERNVTSLCEELKLPQPTASFHLGLLRSFNIVGCRPQGKQRIYGLAGRGTSGKGHVLELPVHDLVVRILPKTRG